MERIGKLRQISRLIAAEVGVVEAEHRKAIEGINKLYQDIGGEI